MQRRNRRAGVEDRWLRADGTESASHGKGLRWRARFVDGAGKERVKGFRRKADAQRWLDDQTTAIVSGTYVDPAASAVTVKDLAEAWYATKSELKPKTLEGYRGLLDALILPKWADMRVGDVTEEAVQAWIGELRSSGVRFTDKGLSASRTIQAHQTLNAVMKYAVRRKHLVVNQVADVELPRKVAVERRYLTHRQVEALATGVGECRVLTLVLAYTGLRWGEAVALRARNVDLERGRATVAESVTRVGSKLVPGPPKSHAHRSVPLAPFLVEELRPILKGMDEEGLVFAGADGSFLTAWAYRSKFDLARPFQDLTPHDLRHTAASLAIQSGANIKAVQRMLGHATATLTLDRYGHLFDDDLDRLADALAETRADALRTDEEKKKVIPLRKTV